MGRQNRSDPLAQPRGAGIEVRAPGPHHRDRRHPQVERHGAHGEAETGRVTAGHAGRQGREHRPLGGGRQDRQEVGRRHDHVEPRVDPLQGLGQAALQAVLEGDQRMAGADIGVDPDGTREIQKVRVEAAGQALLEQVQAPVRVVPWSKQPTARSSRPSSSR